MERAEGDGMKGRKGKEGKGKGEMGMGERVRRERKGEERVRKGDGGLDLHICPGAPSS